MIRFQEENIYICIFKISSKTNILPLLANCDKNNNINYTDRLYEGA
jgi:hypothetical protein